MGISTHVLDTSLGSPAVHVAVSLSRRAGAAWEEVGSGATDQDGRCRELYESAEMQAGVYRVRFETEEYFARVGVRGLYPFVEIAFEVLAGERHYHVPLLLTANGYTTYRGS